MATFRTRRTAKGERRYQARVQGVGSKTFTTRADAQTWAAEKEREKRLGEYHQAPPESFGALMESFLARRKLSWSPGTIQLKTEVKAYLKSLRTVPVASVTYALLDDEIGAIAVHAPRRAQMALDLVKQVLKDAEARGHRIDRRALTVAKPKYESREKRFLSVEQLYELASFSGELHNIILVAGFTGLRQGELFDLRDSDLDLDAGTLTVRQGKTKAARRTIQLIPQAITVLKAQLLSRPPGTTLVFPDKNGERQDRNRGFGKQFRAARDAAGLEGVSFHSLRHTYASLLIQAAFNKGWGESVTPKVLAANLGHADGGALALRTYSHLYPSAQAEAAQALGQLVKEAR